MTTHKHDNYFRYVFSDVKRMAEFLNLLATENKSLARFMDTIDIETLTEISESFSDVKSYGICHGEPQFIGVWPSHS